MLRAFCHRLILPLLTAIALLCPQPTGAMIPRTHSESLAQRLSTDTFLKDSTTTGHVYVPKATGTPGDINSDSTVASCLYDERKESSLPPHLATPAEPPVPLLADYDGNILMLVNGDTVVVVIQYDDSPYGAIIVASSPTSAQFPLHFQSKCNEPETGLCDCSYRYDDPRTAKWLLLAILGESGDVNFTAFCRNDPINSVDPLGLAENVVTVFMPGSNIKGATYGDISDYTDPKPRLLTTTGVKESAVAGGVALAVPLTVAVGAELAPVAAGFIDNAVLSASVALDNAVVTPVATAAANLVSRLPVFWRAAIAVITGYEATPQGRQTTAQTITATEAEIVAAWRARKAATCSGFIRNPLVEERASANNGLGWVARIPKGFRPHPSTYMTVAERKAHAALFDDGASRFMTKSNFEKYGIGQQDGTAFVVTRKQADELIASAGGNARAMERSLGLPSGFLEGNRLMRVDIPNPNGAGLRIPSGNEAGANSQWLPGGVLPNRQGEGVIDVGRLKAGDYQAIQLDF